MDESQSADPGPSHVQVTEKPRADSSASMPSMGNQTSQTTNDGTVTLVGPPAPQSEGDKLRRNISIRHMVFIALGGSIGAGLFVGSGGALHAGGPLSLVLSFAIVGVGVTVTMGSLGELAATYPVAGSFYEYARRFISEPWGFTMGWNFVFAWLIIFPFELSCIVSQIRFWNETVSPAVIISPILAGLIALSFGGSRFYGEVEHGLGIAKVSALTIFIGMAIAIMAGAVPSDARHGTGVTFWTTRDVIANGFPGFMTLFRIAGMAYGGTELLGMTAAECNNPRRALPLATKITFFRIAIFYVLTLLFLGFVVDSQDPGLAKIGHGAQALCEQGMGPRFAATIKWGVPIYAFALAFTIGLTAFVNVAPGGAVIFDWLLSLSGACNYYTWLSICASHIRFRRAWHTQGHSLDELLWTSPFGVLGSWIGIAICSTGLLASIVTSIYPLYGIHSAQDAVRDNLGIAIPMVVLASYCSWEKLHRKRTPVVMIAPADMDLTTGLRWRGSYLVDLEDAPREEAPKSST
ncbi:histidine permease [Verticillium alfalfae VaMs.102]|uniref:Histidine permease n=1 Tax=Verticillium alfalfae (strain VaMs.102 / ATCC MYA-4576 / FGSC 10136) TaxID=526221 RepID=C9SGN1_VERA1|nr:histidine permease [Verticillium alfalfae VaMs.102]EEY18153.1 histidine permease [Verticillium alfalfae VaMs.102]